MMKYKCITCGHFFESKHSICTQCGSAWVVSRKGEYDLYKINIIPDTFKGDVVKEEPKDKKYDAGKPMVGLMEKDFAEALLAVADVTRYGVEKYKSPGSWKLVEDAPKRYEDALGRHTLLSHIEKRDQESGHRHLAHRAWNALAVLQLALMEDDLEG